MICPCHEESWSSQLHMRMPICTTTTLTGRSVTGILDLVNQTPIDWYCKRQATVETATYGSEFNAARTAMEQIMDMQYTLHMLEVPIIDSYMSPTVLFCTCS